ncbi:MAG: nucleoside 2-deoxyribosyltransferase [Desulfomonile tiedjei]|uniref:Nucleoside 2-deoxyribosyltransferase n=1 Tax=Desulfomonile tiedjei TaxID=2358 RepID=A0A9D6V030_9BACT|nr:nucleoside 2-deoxyribosyltransferase [Desulfomonile tiedjei]
MLKVYLASPLGFSPEWKSYRDKIKRLLTDLAFTVLDSWDPKFHKVIEEASAIQDWPARVAAFRDIARQIGRANEDMIRTCDIVFGVLEGAEVDSGTASEIGFAAGLGKKCYGLRSDFRDSGDFDGIPINLQVLYWIEASAGKRFRKIEELTEDTHVAPLIQRSTLYGNRKREDCRHARFLRVHSSR